MYIYGIRVCVIYASSQHGARVLECWLLLRPRSNPSTSFPYYSATRFYFITHPRPPSLRSFAVCPAAAAAVPSTAELRNDSVMVNNTRKLFRRIDLRDVLHFSFSIIPPARSFGPRYDVISALRSKTPISRRSSRITYVPYSPFHTHTHTHGFRRAKTFHTQTVRLCH